MARSNVAYPTLVARIPILQQANGVLAIYRIPNKGQAKALAEHYPAIIDQMKRESIDAMVVLEEFTPPAAADAAQNQRPRFRLSTVTYDHKRDIPGQMCAGISDRIFDIIEIAPGIPGLVVDASYRARIMSAIDFMLVDPVKSYSTGH